LHIFLSLVHTSQKKGWIWMEYLNAFWVGGLICVVGQLLIDLTKLTPARIMVLFVTSGVALGALGLYAPLAEFAGCGATVPLTGFGWALSEGVRKAVAEDGFLGVFTGGFTAGAAGTAAAIFFGYLAALVAKPRDKS
jgi:stage V sporulation protein AE